MFSATTTAEMKWRNHNHTISKRALLVRQRAHAARLRHHHSLLLLLLPVALLLLNDEQASAVHTRA